MGGDNEPVREAFVAVVGATSLDDGGGRLLGERGAILGVRSDSVSSASVGRRASSGATSRTMRAASAIR